MSSTIRKLHSKAIKVCFWWERETFTERFVDFTVYVELIARNRVSNSLAASDASVYFSPITIDLEEWP